jgi:hypothetical protein
VIAWVGAFEQVDESLANGHAFICGDRFTAADLTFAALGGPMVVPPEYVMCFFFLCSTSFQSPSCIYSHHAPIP